jgi:hypothetical protein
MSQTTKLSSVRKVQELPVPSGATGKLSSLRNFNASVKPGDAEHSQPTANHPSGHKTHVKLPERPMPSGVTR